MTMMPSLVFSNSFFDLDYYTSVCEKGLRLGLYLGLNIGTRQTSKHTKDDRNLKVSPCVRNRDMP